MDLYAENILDHFRHPRNKGQGPRAKGANAIVHTEANLSCGDEITLFVTLDGDRISAIEWDGTGCAISQAAMSLLSEELIGKSLNEAEAIAPKNIYEILGVPIGARRVKCALLGLHALKNVIRLHRQEQPQGWMETVGE